MTFLNIGITDIIDIFLVAFLFYQVYMLIKGTTAIKIFTGIAVFYLIWLIVKALNMQLISSILGHVIGVGVMAILIVFQQEIRKFFIYISTKYLTRFDMRISKIWHNLQTDEINFDINEIVKACEICSKTKTGALIVMRRESDLFTVLETGQRINGILSASLLLTIFKKNSPMHDGAVIIKNNIVEASKCVLPLSVNRNLPESFGLRHRSAMGISEQSDAVTIVVSEETGGISMFYESRFRHIKDATDLAQNIALKFNIKSEKND